MEKNKQLDGLYGEGGGGGGKGDKQHTEPDSLRSQDYMEIVLGVSEGPIRGLAPGVHSRLENFFVGDTQLSSPSTGESNWANFYVRAIAGFEDDAPIQYRLGGSASNMGINVQLGQGLPVTRQTSAVQRGRITRLEVRVQFRQLLDIRDDGTYQGTAKFSIEYKPSKASVWRKYRGESVTSIYGKTTAGAVKDFIVDVEVLEDDDWDVRVTKISSDNTSGKGTVVDLVWESMQMVQGHSGKYPDVALVHMYALASTQFSSIPQFSGIYDGLLVKVPSNYNPDTRTYDESAPWDGSFKIAWTNNPAWILYDLCTNVRYGLPAYYLTVSANRYEFYDAAKWCDQPVTIQGTSETQPRFTFNLYLTDARTGLDMLKYVAGAFNATIFDDGNGVISLRTDQYKTPTRLFTPENVSDGQFSYSYTDTAVRYNEVMVSFVNPDLDWAEDRRRASLDNSAWVERNGRVPFDFVAVGCNNVHEAVRRANYRLLTSNTEIATVTFITNRFAMFTELFDTIYVADPDADWGQTGRIKSIDGNTIHLRDPLYFSEISQANMRIQTYDGLVNVTVRPPAQGAVYSLIRVSGNIPLERLPDRPVFTLEDSISIGFAKPFKVVTIEENEDSIESIAITAVEINVNKYPDADSGTVSENVQYSYKTPGEPILPPELVLESGAAHLQVTTDGSIIHRIYSAWERPLNAYTSYYEIDYQVAGDTTWTTVRSYEDDAYLAPVKDGALYNIRLYAVTPLGRRSRKYLERINYSVSGKITGLDNVLDVSVAMESTGWRTKWKESPLPDGAGVEMRTGGLASTWDSSTLIATNVRGTDYLLGWHPEGSTKISLKYRDTSGNYSVSASAVAIEVLKPKTPNVKAETRNGIITMVWDDCQTTQPIARYELRWGIADATWAQASFVTSAAGLNLAVPLSDPTIRRAYLRAVDAYGNPSEPFSFEVGAEDTVDPTPPPTPTGFEVIPGMLTMQIKTDYPTYKVGHGHATTVLYGLQLIANEDGTFPDPTFAQAEQLAEFVGTVYSHPVELSSRWRFWVKWMTNDRYESEVPAGPLEGQSGTIGDKDLGDLIDLANKLGEGSITGDMIAKGALDATKFANGIEPVTIVAGEELPTEKVTSSIVWNGQLYTWDGEKYSAPLGEVNAEDIHGQLSADQIMDGAINTAKFASGLEPVSITSGATLPTEKTTTNIVWNGGLYTWDGTKYASPVGAVKASDIIGQLTSEQIEDISAAKLTGQIVGSQISDNAISAEKIAAGAISTAKLAASAITAEKIDAEAITSAKIKAGAITTAKLDAGAVTADIIAANAVTTAKIQAGAVTAAEIAAGAITASKVLIGDSENLVPNGMFITGDLKGWYPHTNPSAFSVILASAAEVPAGAVSRYVLKAATAGVQSSLFSHDLGYTNPLAGASVSPGEQYRLSARVCSPTAGATLRLYAYAMGAANEQLYDYASVTLAAGAWTDIVLNFTVPAKATRLLWYAVMIAGGGTYYLSDARMSRRVAGELIVDGAITADKIAANAVTAGKLFVGDFSNIITNGAFLLDSEGWEDSATATVVRGTSTLADVPSTYGVLTSAHTANAHVFWKENSQLPVRGGARFRVTAKVSPRQASNPRALHLGLRVRLQNGTSTWITSLIAAASLSNAWHDVSAEVEMPATAVSAVFSFYLSGATASSSSWGVTNVTFREMNAGELIVDGSITAEKLVANSITSAQIAAGAIKAEQIAAGAITASKLTIAAKTTALNTDPNMQDEGMWNVDANMQLVADAAAFVGSKSLRAIGSRGAYYDQFKYEIDETKNYNLRVVAKRLSGTKTLYGVLRFFTAAGAAITTAAGWSQNTTNYYFPSNAAPGTSWTEYNLSFGPDNTAKIPAGAKFFSIGFLMNYSGAGSDDMRIGHVSVTEKVGGVVIDSGAITADKLAVNAIAVGTAAIQNGAITNAMIGNLSADKITTGTLSASLIAAGAITAGHLASNSVTTDKIAAGQITAAKIGANQVTADKINVTSLAAITATIGVLRTASTGARTEIRDNLILVYDANNRLRVRMGIW